MQKIIFRDNHNRKKIKHKELSLFLSRQISLNHNIPKLVRWNALYELTFKMHKDSKTNLSRRCIKTINKKSFHTFSNFSRILFLRLAKLGQISGLKKLSW